MPRNIDRRVEVLFPIEDEEMRTAVVDDILEVTVLRHASVFAVLSAVYTSLAGRASDDNFWKKSLYYQKLFNQARARIRLSIDSGSDGVVDITQIGASGRLLRD